LLIVWADNQDPLPWVWFPEEGAESVIGLPRFVVVRCVVPFTVSFGPVLLKEQVLVVVRVLHVVVRGGVHAGSIPDLPPVVKPFGKYLFIPFTC
jgi:hypothetical protein